MAWTGLKKQKGGLVSGTKEIIPLVLVTIYYMIIEIIIKEVTFSEPKEIEITFNYSRNLKY